MPKQTRNPLATRLRFPPFAVHKKVDPYNKVADSYGMADFTVWNLTDGEVMMAANPAEQTVASFKPLREIVSDDRYLRSYLRPVPVALDGSSFSVVAIER